MLFLDRKDFMVNVGRYANHSATQLAADAAFISWVKYPDETSDLLWTEYLHKYPTQAIVVEKARAFVMEMHIVQETFEESRAKEVWNKINDGIFSQNTSSPVIVLRRWWAAAAVLLVLATGSYFLWRQPGGTDITKTDVPEPKVTNDLVPGGNKAILTLANGTR